MTQSSRGRTWVGGAAGVLGGAIGGAVVALAVVVAFGRADAGQETARAAPRPEAPREGSRIEPSRGSRGVEQHRVQKLEQRLERLEDASDEARRTEEKLAPFNHPPSRAEHVANHEKLVMDHRREAADTQWATSTTRVLTEDLERAKAQGTTFEIAELDCRTTSCVLTATWNTRDEALSQYEYLFHYPLRAPCAREVLVSEEANSAGKFEASIVYDCTDWRSEGADLAEPAAPPLFRPTEPTR